MEAEKCNVFIVTVRENTEATRINLVPNVAEPNPKNVGIATAQERFKKEQEDDNDQSHLANYRPDRENRKKEKLKKIRTMLSNKITVV